jgi:ABC-type lipoprotein export system ATPase subunit
MTKPLFKISQLSCAYGDGPEVLRINSLEIPRNKITVLLGRSGFGKSTLLETLGLMNMTLRGEGDVNFYPDENGESISYRELWKTANLKEIARIRKKYFSFIFQNTNLMPNFTAFENACLTQMISGISYQQAKKKVRNVMIEMGLQDVKEGQRAVNLSGGQKQRLAFVRAITPDFLVLFGDEPTGNLDNYFSEELLNNLEKDIRQHNGSAIIVSHNDRLSVKFADVIIMLTRDGKDTTWCHVSEEHKLIRDREKEMWTDHIGNKIENVILKIDEILSKG